MSVDNPKKLKRLTLKGYKSFREIDGLKLRKGLNVLIGANGSGKSNFISFFEMLGHMMDKNRGLQNYVAGKPNGGESFLFQGSSVTSSIEAKLEFALNTFEFALASSEDGRLFFKKEIATLDAEFGLSTYNKGSGHFESELLKTASYAGEKFAIEAVKAWRVYHFHNTNPKAPMMQPTNAVGSEMLAGDAANIADFLRTMKHKGWPHYYDRIVQHIRQVAPFFGDFVLKPDSQEQLRLLWKEKGSDTVYFPSQFSDGTIRFICLATLLLQPNPPATLILDEPELGLHPHAIMVLAGMLRLAEEKCQIIVSTQSSALVDYLNIEELLVVDRIDGASVIKQPTEEEYAAWLEDYSLSDIWNKNLMGGRPL